MRNLSQGNFRKLSAGLKVKGLPKSIFIVPEKFGGRQDIPKLKDMLYVNVISLFFDQLVAIVQRERPTEIHGELEGDPF